MKLRLYIVLLGACLLSSNVALAQQLSDGNYSGKWLTNYGILDLIQKGDQVFGEYQPRDGRLQGKMENGVFVGSWQEKNSSLAYEGFFEWTMSVDGKRFDGTWSNEYHEKVTWWGKKVDTEGDEAKYNNPFRSDYDPAYILKSSIKE